MMIALRDAPETDETNPIADIELQHKTAIIKCLVAVRSPHQLMRAKMTAELIMGESKIPFVLLLRGVNRVAVGVSDPAGIRFPCKRGRVDAPIGDSRFNLIKRAGEQCGLRSLHAVATASNVDDEEAECAKS